MSSHRPGSNGRIRPKIDVVLEQLLDAALVHDEHHDVDLFSAGLKAPAPLGELHEHGCAPRASVAAAHHTLAVLPAEDECRLLHSGDDHYARGLLPQLVWNALVRGQH